MNDIEIGISFPLPSVSLLDVILQQPLHLLGMVLTLHFRLISRLQQSSARAIMVLLCRVPTVLLFVASEA
jgi:hypothetical protein